MFFPMVFRGFVSKTSVVSSVTLTYVINVRFEIGSLGTGIPIGMRKKKKAHTPRFWLYCPEHPFYRSRAQSSQQWLTNMVKLSLPEKPRAFISSTFTLESSDVRRLNAGVVSFQNGERAILSNGRNAGPDANT